MIFTHLPKSWPDVLEGRRDAADVTLGEWALVADKAIENYGDVVCGVYAGEVVSAYDVTGHERVDGGRVRFAGIPSVEWSSLIGQASPVTWGRGQARPVRYLDTDALRHGTVEIEEAEEGLRRAVVGNFTLTVTDDGRATIVGPAGSSIMVTSQAA